MVYAILKREAGSNGSAEASNIRPRRTNRLRLPNRRAASALQPRHARLGGLGGSEDASPAHTRVRSRCLGLSLRHHYSGQLIEQCLGFLQNRRIKAFAEPAIDWAKQVARFRLPALVAPEPAEAGRGPQLEELRALPLGNSDSLPIVPLSPGPILGGIQ